MSFPHAIDTHAHVYPAAYLDQLERIGVDPSTTAVARGIGADSTDGDIAERLRGMDRADVVVQVLAATPQSPNGLEPGPSLDAARWINDEYARLVDAHPARFVAYGALPLPHVDAALVELPRLFDELGFVGVSLPTVLPDGLTPADAMFDPLWAALDERSAIVNIHATGSGARSDLITDHGLEWVNGAPIEDAIAVLHILKADIPRRFPRVRLHVAHLGGDLPFLAQRLQDNYEDWDAFPESPLSSLPRMWFDSANFHEPSLALAAETFGADRLLAGSAPPTSRARSTYAPSTTSAPSASLMRTPEPFSPATPAPSTVHTYRHNPLTTHQDGLVVLFGQPDGGRARHSPLVAIQRVRPTGTDRQRHW